MKAKEKRALLREFRDWELRWSHKAHTEGWWIALIYPRHESEPRINLRIRTVGAIDKAIAERVVASKEPHHIAARRLIRLTDPEHWMQLVRLTLERRISQ